MTQTGSRAYSGIEGKVKRRQRQRANKGMPSLKRRTRAKNVKMSMTLRGTL